MNSEGTPTTPTHEPAIADGTRILILQGMPSGSQCRGNSSAGHQGSTNERLWTCRATPSLCSSPWLGSSEDICVDEA